VTIVKPQPFPPFLLDLGIPAPCAEYRFAPPRLWRFDYAWPGPGVALEVEGGALVRGRHVSGLGYFADMQKYNFAVLLGWSVLRCSPEGLATLTTFNALSILLNRTATVLRPPTIAEKEIVQMKIGDMLGSFLTAGEVKDGQQFRVNAVTIEQVGNPPRRKVCLSLEGQPKKLALNATSLRFLAEKLGEETDAYAGKLITVAIRATNIGKPGVFVVGVA